MITEKERMILEIILAVIFLAFLITSSIVIINASKGSETETTITNSFNTYNYNTYPSIQNPHTTLTAKPYIVEDDYSRIYYFQNGIKYKDYSQDPISDKRYLYYDSSSEFKIEEGLFRNDINRYEVYVKNRDYVGGNFRVVFFFEDYYGNINSQTMISYISAREEKLFLIKDISPSRYDYRKWWYTVDSLTKISIGNY